MAFWNIGSVRAVQVRSADQKLVRPKEALQPTRDIQANRATWQEIATYDERIKSLGIVHHRKLGKRRSVTALSSKLKKTNGKFFVVFFCFIKIFALSLYHKPKAIAI